MLRIYIHINQLKNFLIYKEPIELIISDPIDSNYMELFIDIDKLIFVEYRNYITVELKSRKKSRKELMNKLWKKKKH